MEFRGGGLRVGSMIIFIVRKKLLGLLAKLGPILMLALCVDVVVVDQ